MVNNLSKTEKLLMTEIYLEATQKGGNCLIKPIDLLSRIPYTIEMKPEELEDTLQALAMDEYIEIVETDKKGEPYYCISLLKKGKAFKREIIVARRNVRYSIMLKILLCAIGVLVTVFLKKIVESFA